MANPTGKGGFQPGHKNVGGRKVGSKNLFNSDARKAILAAMKIVQADKSISKGESFWINIVKRAYSSDVIAVSLLKKFIPDLAATQHSLDKGVVKKVKFEIIESNDKPDMVATSTNKSLEELER